MLSRRHQAPWWEHWWGAMGEKAGVAVQAWPRWQVHIIGSRGNPRRRQDWKASGARSRCWRGEMTALELRVAGSTHRGNVRDSNEDALLLDENHRPLRRVRRQWEALSLAMWRRLGLAIPCAITCGCNEPASLPVSCCWRQCPWLPRWFIASRSAAPIVAAWEPRWWLR